MKSFDKFQRMGVNKNLKELESKITTINMNELPWKIP